jgi:hypothetical protein
MNPEWIEPGDGMGRQIDLTGMRLSAQSSEDRLLDGITTNTPRLRYLTFRAWIISRYWHGKQPDRWESFIEFAARQEAALAMDLAANDYRGTTIVGISEARKLIDSGKSRLPITRLCSTYSHRATSRLYPKRTNHCRPKSTFVRCYSNSGQILQRSECLLCAISDRQPSFTS